MHSFEGNGEHSKTRDDSTQNERNTRLAYSRIAPQLL
jgi:hypothetical protein